MSDDVRDGRGNFPRTIPEKVTNAAYVCTNWAAMENIKEWQLHGVADRRLVERLEAEIATFKKELNETRLTISEVRKIMFDAEAADKFWDDKTHLLGMLRDYRHAYDKLSFVEQLEAKLEIAREALKFYGDVGTYRSDENWHTPIETDDGERAREALAKLNEPETVGIGEETIIKTMTGEMKCNLCDFKVNGTAWPQMEEALKRHICCPEAKSSWISVKDRLPKEYIEVAALYSLDDRDLGPYARLATIKEGGIWEDEWGHKLDVTHWFPIPE